MSVANDSGTAGLSLSVAAPVMSDSFTMSGWFKLFNTDGHNPLLIMGDNATSDYEDAEVHFNTLRLAWRASAGKPAYNSGFVWPDLTLWHLVHYIKSSDNSHRIVLDGNWTNSTWISNKINPVQQTLFEIMRDQQAEVMSGRAA